MSKNINNNLVGKEIESTLTRKLGRITAYSFIILKRLITFPINFLLRKEDKIGTIAVITPATYTLPQIIKSITKENNQPEAKIDIEVIELDKSKLTLACILDVFTKSCFQPEFNMISPGPQNWKNSLDTYSLDALFVESAWHGNNDTWLYKVGKYNENNLDTIKELISACNLKKIPTIFWNKEDPVHFDKFIDSAQRFDYIFTTDANCIPKYLEHTNHKHVYALPFAAQPKIHNPILEQARNKMVCFAGTYHTARYAERKADMDIILKPALSYGLDIYDRMYGIGGKAADNYKFPDIYQSSIGGKLEYEEMVKAYRKYKVFLNVNSVRNSPTMFARRVFELLACGTPVISTYSKGIINLLGENTVFITESEEDTTKYLENLLNNETFWWTHSLHGIRKVLENHTYHHRAKEIFDFVGIEFKKQPPVTFLVVSEVSSIDHVRYLSGMLAQQIYQEFKVLLVFDVAGQFTETQQTEAISFLAPHEVTFVSNDPLRIKKEIANTTNVQYAALFSVAHFYGKNYLRDYALAINYSGSKKLGKKSCFRFNDSGHMTFLNKGSEFKWVTEVPAATLVIGIEELQSLDLPKLMSQDTFNSSYSDILSIDPFNFLFNGSGSPESLYKEIML
jgi:spore maturation protein CgeB